MHPPGFTNRTAASNRRLWYEAVERNSCSVWGMASLGRSPRAVHGASNSTKSKDSWSKPSGTVSALGYINIYFDKENVEPHARQIQDKI